MMAKSFTLHLQDPAQYERRDGVISFVGEDATGSFGIHAGHERFITSLVFSLARYRTSSLDWRYIAVPRALAYFVEDNLYLNTRHYIERDKYEEISSALKAYLAAEEEQLRNMSLSIRKMEEEMLRRLWELGRERRR